MKNLFKLLPKKLLVAAAIVAAVAGLAAGITATGSALLGDNREVKPYTQGMRGFDHVTFNSFTGVPNIGDERNFVHGKISEAPNGFYDPMNLVRAGDEILVRVYVHNNADESTNASGKGVAQNTRVRVSLPGALAQDQKINAFISADNAVPGTIEDTLSVNGEYPFQFDYVEGSARIKTNFMDVALSDNLVTTGVQIGDDKLDGKMNGCFEYVGLVTFKVKIKSPSYQLQKQVRLNGTSEYSETVTAKPGQKVDFVLGYKNVGSTNTSNVVLGDRLPAGMTYVPGTTEWKSAHTNNQWTKVANENLFNGGIDIGNYGPGGAGYIRFTATVDSLDCGTKTVVNTGFAKPKEYGTIEDKASVTVKSDKNCAGPSYVCESLTVEKLGGRKIRVTVKAPGSNGATFKHINLSFGDGTAAKVTNQLVNEYTYTTDGPFKVTAEAVFTVNGEDKKVSSAACAADISFTTTPPTTPPTTSLPKTGAGSTVALFAIVTLVGAVAHNLLSRRASL